MLHRRRRCRSFKTRRRHGRCRAFKRDSGRCGGSLRSRQDGGGITTGITASDQHLQCSIRPGIREQECRHELGMIDLATDEINLHDTVPKPAIPED